MGNFLCIHSDLLAHGSQHNNAYRAVRGKRLLRSRRGIWGLLTDVLLLSFEESLDLLTDLTRGKLDIILGSSIILHQVKETVVTDIQLR